MPFTPAAYSDVWMFRIAPASRFLPEAPGLKLAAELVGDVAGYVLEEEFLRADLVERSDGGDAEPLQLGARLLGQSHDVGAEVGDASARLLQAAGVGGPPRLAQPPAPVYEERLLLWRAPADLELWYTVSARVSPSCHLAILTRAAALVRRTYICCIIHQILASI